MKTNIPQMFWPDFRTGALTGSWDDGTLADRRLVGIYKENGLKATWNLNSGLLGKTKEETKFQSHVTREEVAELYDGQEVACHSCFHAHLFHQPDALVLADIIQDRIALEELVGYPIIGMVTPMVPSHNARLIPLYRQAGFLHCRHEIEKGRYDVPDDFMNWNATCHYNDDILARWEDFETTHRPGQLFYVYGHSYSLDKNNDWEMFEAFAAQAGKTENIWHATKAEILEYLHAWRTLRSSAAGNILKNTSHLTLYFGVDGKKTALKPGDVLRLG